MALLAVWIAAGVNLVRGQDVSLVTLNTTWRYNQTGTNLGASWITPGYDDTATGWEGPGLPLFGFETNEDQYNALGVYFTTRFPSPQITFRTNYYFRTHFNMPSYSPGILAATTLLTSNWIDDGAVFYLNGVELGRFNMTSNQVTATTFASANLTEPVFFRTNYTATSLVGGDNVLAVEVHQTTFNNSDVVFGMTMTAMLPSAPAIITQPLGQTNVVGATNAILSVIATGTAPLFYQWYSNAAPVLRATNVSYTVASAKTNSANYYAVVTNVVGVATSAVVRVAIVLDTFPPTLISAFTGPPPSSVGDNQVLVTFNERLNPSTAGVTNNYIVSILGSPETLPIVLAQYAAPAGSSGSQVKLTCSSALVPGINYVLTVNRVTDTNRNSILPNSQIGITFSSVHVFTNLISMDQNWVWDENLDDPGTAWKETDYVVPSSWGGPASGFFYALGGGGAPPRFSCGSANPTPLGGYSTWAYYFRTHFNLPSRSGPEGILTFTHLIDDGAIFYLNGAEIFRYNMPSGAVGASDFALSQITNATCIATNVVVTNLMATDNVLAVEVHQASDFDFDFIFGTIVDLNYPITSPLPPKLAISKQLSTNQVLSWSNTGQLNWGLEFATDLLNSNATWTPLPDPSPYTNSGAETRYFRLQVR